MDRHERTIKILDELKAVGYDIITIGNPDEANPTCKNWMNGPCSFWGWSEKFLDKKQKEKACRINGWCAIWSIVDKYTSKSSCGNTHQKQITLESANTEFVSGTYDLRNITDISDYVMKCSFMKAFEKY